MITKTNSTWIFCMFILFTSCNNDQNEVITAYKNYLEIIEKNQGDRLIEMIDEDSKNYLKNLRKEIIAIDSFKISKLKYIDRYNILSARSIIKDDSINKIDYQELFATLVTKSRFGFRQWLITGNSIANTQIKDKEANITLQNGIKVKLNKVENSWKINLKSIDESKNKVLEEQVGTIVANNSNYSTSTKAINLILYEEIAQNSIKPFDFLYWPIGMKENELKFLSKKIFAENLECNNNQSWAIIKDKKIIFFLTDDETSKEFYSKFKESLEFRKFCSEDYHVIILTAYCEIGRPYFKKYDVLGSPNIIVIDENNNIVQRSAGYFITPEMFLKNSKITGKINYDVTKILSKN